MPAALGIFVYLASCRGSYLTAICRTPAGTGLWQGLDATIRSSQTVLKTAELPSVGHSCLSNGLKGVLACRVEQVAAEKGITLQWEASSDDEPDHMEINDSVSRISQQHQPVSPAAHGQCWSGLSWSVLSSRTLVMQMHLKPALPHVLLDL